MKHVRTVAKAHRKLPLTTIKRAYRNIKNHPIPSSIGLITLSAGLISSVYVFLKRRKH